MRKLLYKTFSLLGKREIERLEKASRDPEGAQQERLLEIISANARSAFGKVHSFETIRSIKDFQSRVPIRDYDQLRPYIDRSISGERSVLTSEEAIAYATTSGTTGNQKYIPITKAYLKEFRRASVASGYHLLRNFPELAKGVTFSVLSAAETGRTPKGVPYGAISGQLYQREPALIKKVISPIPYAAYLIDDYESRYYTLLRLALALPLSLMYTLNPSTIVLLMRKLSVHAPALIKDLFDGTFNPPVSVDSTTRKALAPLLSRQPDRARYLQRLMDADRFVAHLIWPTLQVVSCWTKAAAAFYLDEFPRYFGGIPVCDITYGASEGRGTVFLNPAEQMLAIRSHFFEFVPESQMQDGIGTPLLAHELEIGCNYYVLFTTSSGLYRYNINDVVKVVGLHNRTPLLEFQYKGGNVSSFTGEKLTEVQVTTAMSAAVRARALPVRFFTLVPRFSPEPHYELLVEFDSRRSATIALSEVAALFDRCLGDANVEYKAKRDSGRLGAVVAKAIDQGAYDRFRTRLASTGVPDSQIKVSHLNPKQEVREYFVNQVTSHASANIAAGGSQL